MWDKPYGYETLKPPRKSFRSNLSFSLKEDNLIFLINLLFTFILFSSTNFYLNIFFICLNCTINIYYHLGYMKCLFNCCESSFVNFVWKFQYLVCLHLILQTLQWNIIFKIRNYFFFMDVEEEQESN